MRPQCLLTFLAMLLASSSTFAQAGHSEQWVATWGTAVVGRPQSQPASAQQPAPAAAAAAPAGRQGGPPPPVTVANQTVRQVVRTSVGGSRVRVVLSNAFGTAPVAIGAAYVGLREKDATVKAATARPLLFSGGGSFTLPAGASVVSDPVTLTMPPFADLVVDLYLPGEVGLGPSPVTMHNGASQTNYISPSGNHAGAVAMSAAAKPASWFLLSRVEVSAPANTGAVVTFGDSITDGARSTVDTNSRWPDVLAKRLGERDLRLAVVNAGISGNRLLGEGAPQAGINALARFDRDVLMQTGVTHVIVLEGINDIGVARNNPSPTAADLISAHKQLIERARARGLKIFGATLTPFEGAAYWTPEGEAKRKALNDWIRTSSAYDGVIDFDQATRDPAAPTKFLPTYDSGDHLHPGDVGYKAMGDAVDLKLFKE